MNKIIIYTNSRRLYRFFDSEIVALVMLFFAVLTGILTMITKSHMLGYVYLIWCLMILLFLTINGLLCYRPDMGFLRIRRLR